MKHLGPVLPLAALLLVGSCRDVNSPTTSVRSLDAPASRVYAPFDGYGSTNFTSAANAVGETVRRQPPTYVINTNVGGGTITAADITQIDNDGSVFGLGQFGAPYWRLTNGTSGNLTKAFSESISRVVGRKLASGEVIVAYLSTDNTVSPVSDRVKLYRWGSVSGLATVALSLNTTNPSLNPPRLIGVTADGGVAWSRQDPNTFQTSIYRTKLDNSVIQYMPPSGHVVGEQYPVFNGSTQYTGALAPDGALVGQSQHDATITPVRWAPDGTPEVLPYTGTNTAAREIRGNYVLGITKVNATQSAPIRWFYNGSSWDSYTYPALANPGGPVYVKMNDAGFVAAQWSAGGATGYSYGDPGSSVFEPDLLGQANGRSFLTVSDLGFIHVPFGFLVPTPQVSAPPTLGTVAHVLTTLPIKAVSPYGAARFPMTWSVKWALGLNSQENSGTWNTPADVEKPKHVYVAPGTFTARVIIIDSNGDADTSSTTVSVFADGKPTADVAPHSAVEEGNDVVLSAAPSTDPNALPLTYTWRFDGSGKYPGETFTLPGVPRGSHSFRLIVENSAGIADTVIGLVTVANAAPTARFVVPLVPVLEGVNFDVKVEGLQDAPGDKSGIQTQIDCGAGYPAGWGTDVTATCALGDGLHLTRLKLRDVLGAEREYLKVITVANRPPKITTLTLHAGTPGKWRLKYLFSDHPDDANGVVTFQVNGVRQGGTQVTPREVLTNGLWLNAQSGDVLTVRVRDKDGAYGARSLTIP